MLKFRTDGGSMDSQFTFLVTRTDDDDAILKKCPRCGGIFQFLREHIWREFAWDRSIPFIQFPENSEYLDFANTAGIGRRPELLARFTAWQLANSLNNVYRIRFPRPYQSEREKEDHTRITFHGTWTAEKKAREVESLKTTWHGEFSDLQHRNMEKLSGMLEEGNSFQRIIKAELVRERKDYSAAIRLLEDAPQPEENYLGTPRLGDSLIESIRMLCRFEISIVSREGDLEFALEHQDEVIGFV